MLANTEWAGGLRDRTLAVTAEQRRAVEPELQATIKNITHHVFQFHGICASPRRTTTTSGRSLPNDKHTKPNRNHDHDNTHSTRCPTRLDQFPHAGRPDVSAQPGSVQRAFINAGQYQKMYERSIKDPDGFWLEQAATLDWFKSPTKGRKYIWNTVGENSRTHLVRGRPAQRDGELPRPPFENQDARQNRPHLAGRTGGRRPHVHLRAVAPGSLQIRQRAEIARRQKRRPRFHLSADDSRIAHRHARLRADGRHSLGRVRRFQRRGAGRAHQRRHLPPAHHLQCLPAFRQEHSAQGHRRRGAEANQEHQEGHRRQTQRATRAT